MRFGKLKPAMPNEQDLSPLHACPVDILDGVLYLPPCPLVSRLTRQDVAAIVAAVFLFTGVGCWTVFNQHYWLCGGAKTKSTRALVNKVAGAVTVYASDNAYPQGLGALVEAKLIKWKQLKDPWSQELRFSRWSARPGVEFDVCSAGEDKWHFTADDICHD